MPTATVPELYQQLRDKFRSGDHTIADFLSLIEEHKRFNYYATQLGRRTHLGLDGGGTVSPDGNLLVFYFERDVWFLGEDAKRAFDILEAFARNAEYEQQNLLMDSSHEGSIRALLNRFKRGKLKLDTYEGVPRLSLWASHWNDWLFAIYKSGVGLDGFQVD